MRGLLLLTRSSAHGNETRVKWMYKTHQEVMGWNKHWNIGVLCSINKKKKSPLELIGIKAEITDLIIKFSQNLNRQLSRILFIINKSKKILLRAKEKISMTKTYFQTQKQIS